MKSIAVMQPYFFPYAGYFRLFAAADTVVMFDCVQFPRRGWVHRNRFIRDTGDLDWLTLPVAKTERTARIDELRFAPDAEARLESAMRRFPLLARSHQAAHPLTARMLRITTDDVATYLCDLVRDVAEILGFNPNIVRSSSMRIDPELRGQARVLAIVKELGGTRYVNPSGGRHLYDSDTFESAGIDLRFLTPYQCTTASILSRLLNEPASQILQEIQRETILAA